MSKWMFEMLPAGAFCPRPDGRMALHGGKGGGSSAPPPDPRLIEAQIRSMGFQDDAIKQIMGNSADLAPLQKRQLLDSITRGDALYGQSQEDRTYGLQRRGELTGLQDRLVSDARNFNEPARQEEMAAQAQADVASAYNNSADQLARRLGRSGVNPNSGNALAMQNQNAIAQAADSASASNKTRQAARLEGFQLTDRATNAFTGYPASTSSSVGTGLSSAGFGLSSANSGLAGLNAGYSAAGGIAGQMGSNASGMYGAMGNYKSQQDKIASEQSDPFGAILGKGLGAFATAYGAGLGSDRRLKEDIVLVGRTQNGHNVYTFRYKSGGPVVMGVMADEVERTHPEAVHKRAIGGVFDAVDYALI